MQFAEKPAIFNRIQGLLEEIRELWRQNSEFILGSHLYNIFFKAGRARFFSLPSFYVSPFKLEIMGCDVCLFALAHHAQPLNRNGATDGSLARWTESSGGFWRRLELLIPLSVTCSGILCIQCLRAMQ